MRPQDRYIRKEDQIRLLLGLCLLGFALACAFQVVCDLKRPDSDPYPLLRGQPLDATATASLDGAWPRDKADPIGDLITETAR